MAIKLPYVVNSQRFPSSPAQNAGVSDWRGGTQQAPMAPIQYNPMATTPAMPQRPVAPKTIQPQTQQPVVPPKQPQVQPQQGAVGAAGPSYQTRAYIQNKARLHKEFITKRSSLLNSIRGSENYQKYWNVLSKIPVGNYGGLDKAIKNIQQQEQFLQQPPEWAQNMSQEERSSYVDTVSSIPNQVEASAKELYPEMFEAIKRNKLDPRGGYETKGVSDNIKKGIGILGDVSESFLPEPELQQPSMSAVRQYGSEVATQLQERSYNYAKQKVEVENLQRRILYDLRRRVIQRSANGQIDSKTLAIYASDLAEVMLSGNMEAMSNAWEEMRRREETLAQQSARDKLYQVQY